jgi:SAM domain (Sterile alpha motif)
MDIVVWLRGLGLGKYEAAFRENEIDETVLPSLTEEHLKQLGVTALGHRVKLLDAIAALRGGTSPQGPSSDLKTAPAAPSVPPEDRAERRQVTVMFSDLVGSTALSARMDPKTAARRAEVGRRCSRPEGVALVGVAPTHRISAGTRHFTAIAGSRTVSHAEDR